MGTTFVAITTSLPELASTLGAVRLGAIDLAVGNLLGSNLFNLAILALNDGIQAPPGLWAVIATEHRYNALVSLLMHAGLWVALSRSGSYARSP
jgi:cation:H+ antiporter